METLKTVVLIMFIVGIIGAVNAVITQSQNPNKTSALGQLAKIVGFSYKAPVDPSRPLNYVPGKINDEKPTKKQAGSTFTPSSPRTSQTTVAPQPSPSPVSTITNNTKPPTPPIPPSGPNTLGEKDQLALNAPPPPVVPDSKTLEDKDKTPTTQNNSTQNSVYDNLVKFVTETVNSFGF